jgi:PKD repeat protein
VEDEPEPPENNPPAFTSTPPLSATVGAAYRYEIAASDPDASDVLTITAPLLPAWLSVTDAGDGTATLSGTPDAEGVYAVGLLVQDSGGLNDTQAFSITVRAADEPEPPENNPPAFTSTPPLSATVGAAYRYEIAASDPDASDVLTVTAPLLPEWLALEDESDWVGVLNGTPQASDVGTHTVELLVQDSGGLSDTQAFSITVRAADEPEPDPANTLFLPRVQR